jgi:hypothetical protein
MCTAVAAPLRCRAKLDPDNILGNKLLDTLLGTPGQPSAVKA